jgi:membrane dipeptidase
MIMSLRRCCVPTLALLIPAATLVVACMPTRQGTLIHGSADRQADTSDSVLLARAREIHERVITIDTHAGGTGDTHDTCGSAPRQVDLPKMKKGGLDVAFFTVYAAQAKRTPENYASARDKALEVFQTIHRLTEKLCPDRIELASSPEDVERIVAGGKLAAAIGMENGFMIGTDLSLLQAYKELGGAYFGLTHQGHNDIADSSEPSTTLGDTESEHGGMSPFGERVIAELNRLGIMVDVSHASNEAARDAMRLSRAPVVASHSSVYALAAHPRNMDDETLLALRENGGVIQITPVSWYLVAEPPEATAAFTALWREVGVENFSDVLKLDGERRAEFERRNGALEERWPLATVRDLVDHIDYVVRLIGIDQVGIGSDFEGGGGVTGWMDAGETANVTVELVRRGYSEEEIQKIWGGNLLRVWREVRQSTEDRR